MLIWKCSDSRNDNRVIIRFIYIDIQTCYMQPMTMSFNVWRKKNMSNEQIQYAIWRQFCCGCVCAPYGLTAKVLDCNEYGLYGQAKEGNERERERKNCIKNAGHRETKWKIFIISPCDYYHYYYWLYVYDKMYADTKPNANNYTHTNRPIWRSWAHKPMATSNVCIEQCRSSAVYELKMTETKKSIESNACDHRWNIAFVLVWHKFAVIEYSDFALELEPFHELIPFFFNYYFLLFEVVFHALSIFLWSHFHSLHWGARSRFMAFHSDYDM